MLYRGIPIEWRQDFDGARHHPDVGRGRHGIVEMGTISRAKASDVRASDTEWSWSMTVTGAGRTNEGSRGIAASKAEAIEACNASYVARMSIGENYERAVAHYEDMKARMEAFDRRGSSHRPSGA